MNQPSFQSSVLKTEEKQAKQVVPQQKKVKPKYTRAKVKFLKEDVASFGQQVWKILFVVIVIVSTILVKKLYTFHTHEHFSQIQKGYISEILKYSLPFAVIFTIFDIIVHKIFDPICEKHFINQERYSEPEAKKRRCYTLVKWAYSIIYYIVSSVWGYKIICGTTFLPTWLGGLGTQLYDVGKQLDMPQATLQMRIFYILQAGKHMSRFFSHLFIRPEGAFFQYALHHGLSVFLILFSFLFNQWLIGIFVLVIHDYSDFGLILGRGYKDYKHARKAILDIIAVHGFTAWIVCRIILFCYQCIYVSIIAVWKQSKLDDFSFQIMRFPHFFMVGMMMGLQVLHLYWTYFIIETFVSIKVSPKLAKHTYD